MLKIPSLAGLVLQFLGIGVLVLDFFKSNPFSPLSERERPFTAEDYWASSVGKIINKWVSKLPWIGKRISRHFGLNYYSEAFGYEEFCHTRQVILLISLVLAGMGTLLQIIAIVFSLI